MYILQSVLTIHREMLDLGKERDWLKSQAALALGSW